MVKIGKCVDKSTFGKIFSRGQRSIADTKKTHFYFYLFSQFCFCVVWRKRFSCEGKKEGLEDQREGISPKKLFEDNYSFAWNFQYWKLLEKGHFVLLYKPSINYFLPSPCNCWTRRDAKLSLTLTSFIFLTHKQQHFQRMLCHFILNYEVFLPNR